MKGIFVSFFFCMRFASRPLDNRHVCLVAYTGYNTQAHAPLQRRLSEPPAIDTAPAVLHLQQPYTLQNVVAFRVAETVHPILLTELEGTAT
jgi:hypothetical protein